jgi:exodeoxyribonuclease-3
MRIATWNVNSIRTRYGRVVDFMVREDVDVLAMQEIKCTADQFPHEAFERAGYEVAINGFNQWNGVAIASRSPITDVAVEFPGMPGFLKGQEGADLPKEARAIGATVEGVRMWSLYVPNGRSLGDPHYTYKLDWLAALADHARAETSAHPEVPFALMGDFNIAPLDEGNGDPAVVEGLTTHVSPPERQAFFTLEDAA